MDVQKKDISRVPVEYQSSVDRVSTVTQPTYQPSVTDSADQ